MRFMVKLADGVRPEHLVRLAKLYGHAWTVRALNGRIAMVYSEDAASGFLEDLATYDGSIEGFCPCPMTNNRKAVQK